MKKMFCSFLICFTIITATPSSYAAKSAPQKSMLEIREIQTHIFDTPDTNRVTKAVINTLQDNGFIIQNIEPKLGYIRAKKEVKLKRTKKGRVVAFSFAEALYITDLVFTFGLDPYAYMGLWQSSMQIKNEIAPHTVIFDSNINIQKIGKSTKVRFIVIEKVLENGDGYTTVKSSPRQVNRHYEPELYQNFFSQVDKNLFFEKNL